MKTLKSDYRKDPNQPRFTFNRFGFCRNQRNRFFGVVPIIGILAISSFFARCKKDSDETNSTPATPVDQYTLSRAISDEAQRNTIAFDGLARLPTLHL